MADVKITQLPAALSVNDTDNLILDDGSSTYRVVANMLKAYIIGDIPADIDAAVAAANENLAPAYNASSTYAVGDLCIYQGKLYKCIVAVTSSEAFNPIKWDDVTMSEYVDKKKYHDFTTDGTETWSEFFTQIFEWIHTNVPQNDLITSNLHIGRVDGNFLGAPLYRLAYYDSDGANYSMGFNNFGSSYTKMSFDVIQIQKINDVITNMYYETSITYADGSVSAVDFSNNIITARTLRVYY